MSFGKGGSKSKVVTWKDILTPWQQSGQEQMAPFLTQAGIQGIQGIGISPQERARQTSMLSGSIADYASGLRRAAQDRASSLGQYGGVVSSPLKNIDASKIMAYGQGLRSIEDMNQQLAQQKVANMLSFLTWSPPTATESKSSNFSLDLSSLIPSSY